MNNISYKKYITDGLEGISKNFSVKTYKLACQEDWMGFKRGRDVRIQIQWKGKCIWEWILEKSFWFQNNTNKEDKNWMRRHADIKLNACKNAVIKKNTTKSDYKPSNIQVCQTQKLFDKMKQQK